MPLPNSSCAVALPRVRNNATDAEQATGNATATATNTLKAASLQELRTQLRAQLARNYSGGCETEKQAELRTSKSATAPAERARPGDAVAPETELIALVNAVAAFHGFTLEQTAEAQQIAQADPVAALECFRALVAKIPGIQPATDDRITCNQCANLAGRKCAKWKELGAARGWEPVQLSLRCEQFKPEAGEADQRTGAERWPNLKKEH